MSDLLARLEQLRSQDVPTHGGRTLAYVYDSGLAEADEVARAAVAAFSASNGLDPTAFPSLLQMENELVGFAANLLQAPDTVVGSVTSGGTESCLLAVQSARDGAAHITKPAMVVPTTVHPAFRKAAHYFGVRLIEVPVGDDFRADAAAMVAAITDDVVLVVVSAPSYAHGVVDPVTEVAAAAAARGIRCHVDACIGGWVLPYATRLGRGVAPWTFAVEGVSSISLDLHKYAYAPKGTSILLYRDATLRKPQYFASADWPGYTMLNSTMQSTKSGGPLAGAWATVNTITDAGYLELARTTFAAVDELVAAIEAIEHLHLVAQPDSTLVVFGTDTTCDVFTIADLMGGAGWWVQPQMSYRGQPASIHLSLSAATAPRTAEFVDALQAAVTQAVAQGPVRVADEIVELIETLDPDTLTDADFDGLLAAVGMAGGDSVGLPESMAEINTLLNLAAPALREALLIAFLDRLQRPAR